MTKFLYVITENGDPIVRHSTSEVQCYASLEMVQAWTEVTPYHKLEVQDAMPYVSIAALRELPQTPEVKALIAIASLGIPPKPVDPAKK